MASPQAAALSVLEGAAVEGRMRQEMRRVEALLNVQVAHRTHLQAKSARGTAYMQGICSPPSMRKAQAIAPG